jgi:hypothetical protein
MTDNSKEVIKAAIEWQSLAVYFMAMFHSESWYEHWRRTSDLHAKTRALVLFDRVMTVRIGVIQ